MPFEIDAVPGDMYTLYLRPVTGGKRRPVISKPTRAACATIRDALLVDYFQYCVLCEGCEDLLCELHRQHWFDCPCPGPDELFEE